MAVKTHTAKLTAKQEMFCHEYLVDLNATQAAMRAGYSQKTARQLAAETLAKPYIMARINALKAKRMARVEIDANYVLRQAKKLHKKCMSDEQWNPAGAAKGLELIGKHVDVQAFNEKSSANHTIDVSGLPDAELDAIIASVTA
jgi:phage terminase small subunit